MNLDEAADRWARTWERAWNARQLEPIVELYAPAAVFSSQPFRTPYRGRDGVHDFVAGAFAEEDAVSARFGRPVVGADRAAVPWWATLTENGAGITLAGTSLLRFDGEGRVVEQWDTWNQSDGHRQPPEGWQ